MALTITIFFIIAHYALNSWLFNAAIQVENLAFEQSKRDKDWSVDSLTFDQQALAISNTLILMMASRIVTTVERVCTMNFSKNIEPKRGHMLFSHMIRTFISVNFFSFLMMYTAAGLLFFQRQAKKKV